VNFTPTIIGLDLSLTATGIAGTADGGWADTITTRKLVGHERLAHIRRAIFTHYLNGVDHPYVAVEGPSYGSTTGSFHERAGLWWLIVHALWRRDIPCAVITPAGLKRYACGKGNASKDQVLVAVTRRFPWCPSDNNAADAVTLAAMAADHLQVSTWPTVPAVNRTALAAVHWPQFEPQSIGAAP
jgi:crossover junction endodeoxyribonuclease RuvC